jgi:hypothetical protein
MAKKNLGNVSDGETIVAFSYNGKEYTDKDSNLELRELTPEQVRISLNRAPAKYAYWSSLLAEVNFALDDLSNQFDFWFAEKYNIVVTADPKTTETAKKNNVMLNNAKEYKVWLFKLGQLRVARDKLSTIVKAYEMQSRTLQTVAGLIRSELERMGDA